MPVHKKVAKAIKKVGKKALKRVGVRLSKVLPRTKGVAKAKGIIARRAASKKFRKVEQRQQSKTKTKVKASSISKGPKKHLGPPRVGMRSVKGRKSKITTIKRPRPRST